jgi:hypothetical protein
MTWMRAPSFNFFQDLSADYRLTEYEPSDAGR